MNQQEFNEWLWSLSEAAFDEVTKKMMLYVLSSDFDETMTLSEIRQHIKDLYEQVWPRGR